MAQWQAAEAGQNFTGLVEAACGEGPQIVMRDEDPLVIVLSSEDYRRLVRQADSNFERLLEKSEEMTPLRLGLSIAV